MTYDEAKAKLCELSQLSAHEQRERAFELNDAFEVFWRGIPGAFCPVKPDIIEFGTVMSGCLLTARMLYVMCRE